jgi:hypothetical protein
VADSLALVSMGVGAGLRQGLKIEEVMERPQVLDGELREGDSKPSKEIGTAGRQDDVVNIEQHVGGLGAVSKDKQRDVEARRPEAELVEGRLRCAGTRRATLASGHTRSARACTHARGDPHR